MMNWLHTFHINMCLLDCQTFKLKTDVLAQYINIQIQKLTS